MDPVTLFLGAATILAAGAYFFINVGSVVLQPIQMPTRLEQNGYGSTNFTHLVLNEIDSIYFLAGSDYTGAKVQLPSSGVTVAVGGANISLSDMKLSLGQMTGTIKYQVEGTVIDRDGKLVLKLNAVGTGGDRYFITESAAPDQPYALVQAAARDVVRIVDPYVAMKMQFENDKIAGDFTRSLGMIQDLLPRMDRTQYHFLYDIEGRAYDLARQPDKAIAAYRTSIQFDPTYPIAYSNLALTLREAGRASEADAMDRKAVGLNPDFFDFFRFWAEAYRTAGLNDRCVYNFSRYLNYAQHDAQAYYDMGTCLRAEGHAAESADAFAHARALDPDFAAVSDTK